MTAAQNTYCASFSLFIWLVDTSMARKKAATPKSPVSSHSSSSTLCAPVVMEPIKEYRENAVWIRATALRSLQNMQNPHPIKLLCCVITCMICLQSGILPVRVASFPIASRTGAAIGITV